MAFAHLIPILIMPDLHHIILMFEIEQAKNV